MVRRVVLVLALVIVAAGCGSIELGSTSNCDETEQAPARCLQFAGFTSVEGLEVSDLRIDSFQDTLVRFRLQGPSEAIDRALASASFTTAAEPGTVGFQLGPEVDLAALEDVHAASDRWIDAGKQAVHRQILRGRRRDDPAVEVLYVHGFTT